MFLTRIVVLGAALIQVLPPGAGAQRASVTARQPHVEFGKVVRGTIVEREFTVANQTASALRIGKVQLSPPLLPTHIPPEIPAHQEAVLRVKLDTSTLAGTYEGEVLLSFKDPDAADVHLSITGRVVLPIEVTPSAIFAAAERGQPKEVSIDIVNHEPEPVLIGGARHAPERFTTRLETVEEGRRFRLTLELKPDGPAGKSKEIITLKTSSPNVPELKIVAFTYLHERVYTFPDAVDLGVLRLEELRRSPDVVKMRSQTLMVYRKGTSDFEVTATADLPQLVVRSERGPLGDRYQLTISVAPDRLTPGLIRGSIVIETDDPEFPMITVPVSGAIVGGPD